MKILSFIVPAYNSEQYLDKCLASLLEHDVLDKIEVIVVNDGSTDATAEIARGYCDRYPGTVRLISQENKGHGGALNTGCAAAAGKYLKVVDSDDWIVTENLPELLDKLEACQADAVLTPFHRVDMTTGDREEKPIGHIPKMPITLKQIMERWDAFDEACSFHGVTYRTEFYRSQNHQLPEHIFYEDQEYCAIPFCRAQSVAVFDLYFYQYLVGNPFQSVAFVNQAKRIHHMERVVMDIVDYYRNAPGMKPEEKAYLLSRIQAVSLIYLSIAALYEPDRKKGREECRDFYRKLSARCPQAAENISRKYQVFLKLNTLHMSPAVYRKMVESGPYRWLKYGHKDGQEA